MKTFQSLKKEINLPLKKKLMNGRLMIGRIARMLLLRFRLT